jgi:hypothetical protein
VSRAHAGHRHAVLLPRSVFLRRLAKNALIGIAVIAGSLLLGTAGYHGFAGLSWIDALLNASMILGGMGPVNELHTTAGKLFASAYALFSGLAFLATAGILLAPVAHRLLHRLHADR